jgi:outer membrane murein-binding lipoprotein Lpp
MKAATFRNMPISFRQFAIVFAVALPACALGGCGTINEKLAYGLGDYIPHWAGGLPADAPPRPGTAKYDELMKERERKRLEPAAPTDTSAKANASLDPVH